MEVEQPDKVRPEGGKVAALLEETHRRAVAPLDYGRLSAIVEDDLDGHIDRGRQPEDFRRLEIAEFFRAEHDGVRRRGRDLLAQLIDGIDAGADAAAERERDLVVGGGRPAIRPAGGRIDDPLLPQLFGWDDR